jgi:anti-sigma B factor antagonist
MLKMHAQNLAEGIRKITLTGSMDIDGTQSIELQLNTQTSVEKAQVILDLAGVDFMASIGIGVIVQCARSARRRGGNLVILAPQPVVSLVLTKTRIDTVVPIAATFDEALRLLRAAPPKA